MSEKSACYPPESLSAMEPQLDRRQFLGTVGLAAGAVVAASVVPAAVRGASLRDQGVPSEARAPIIEQSSAVWDVDDMWGHWPRYAHAVPYAHGIAGAGALESSGPYSVLGRELEYVGRDVTQLSGRK